MHKDSVPQICEAFSSNDVHLGVGNLFSVAVFIPMFLPRFSDVPVRLVLDKRQSCILTTSLMAFKYTQSGQVATPKPHHRASLKQ